MNKFIFDKSFVLIISILLIGCFKNPFAPDQKDSNAPESEDKQLFIVETDFQSGLLESMNTTERKISPVNLSIYSDAKIFSYGKYLYILERFGANNVIKIDPTGDNLQVIYQKNLGGNFNPYDIEFVNENKAYIANQDEPLITIFNPENGNIIGNIDISQYIYMPDSNKSPYASSLVLVDNYLYVLLQRRNMWQPGAPSLILKINILDEKVIDTISLKFTNGYDMVYHNGFLYVANPGNSISLDDGGIETVNLSSKDVTTIIEEKDLKGNPNRIIHKKDNLFYVVSYVSWNEVKVVELNVTTKEIKEIEGIKNAYEGICYDKEEELLYVVERDPSEVGIKVVKDNKIIASQIRSEKSLPPFDILIFEAE